MLIMPPDHARAVMVPRRFSTRERFMVRTVLGAVAALLVALAISLAKTGRTSHNGCVDVTIAYATGGQELYRCGEAARAMCASVDVRGGYGGAVASAVAAECRKAGVAVR